MSEGGREEREGFGEILSKGDGVFAHHRNRGSSEWESAIFKHRLMV